MTSLQSRDAGNDDGGGVQWLTTECQRRRWLMLTDDRRHLVADSPTTAHRQHTSPETTSYTVSTKTQSQRIFSKLYLVRTKFHKF